jgi:hypothetical protein
MLVLVDNKIIAGDQNCSTCKLTYPLCGKKKAVHVGFCRSPFILEVNGENHLPFEGENKQ